METTDTTIITPDQRLRVFVSSTLQELAEERGIVRQAIQNLRLTPVMFEMGARDHAPRNLYRQYLSQSQIFVGIYWDRYGWVAPEETVSGLEDEYNLSGDMPKLIYIKQSAAEREERLEKLLDRIRQDDKVSYKTFNTAEELGNLIMNDLAVLLTERFNMTMQQKYAGKEGYAFSPVPFIPNSIVGRDRDVSSLEEMLSHDNVRLVTLTGTGGIGKTRLAIEMAHRLASRYTDGSAFIPLAPVREDALVAETICYGLGIKVSGDNVLESLKLFLLDKNFLLVLDNFEQVIQAASIVDDLLLAAPGLRILVTSRERLSLSFENVYVVNPLSNDQISGIPNDALPPAVELFIQRARAIQPSFTVNEINRETVIQLCRRLEGLPLAIELAAGQINLFSPAQLLRRLEKSLDVLKGNFRDIPDRQKTIRDTIEWSYTLLSGVEQTMFLRMSLFRGGCQIEAIEFMCGEKNGDVYEVLMSLINKSLVMKQDDESGVRFMMFESIREFALTKLFALGELDIQRKRMAQFYHQSLDGVKLQKNKVDQVEMLKRLEKEHANIRQALEYFTRTRNVKAITDISWNLWLFWWVNAHTKEGHTWLKGAWEMVKRNPQSLDQRTFAILAANMGFMSFLQRDMAGFAESLGRHLPVILKQPDEELVATAALVTGVVKTIVKEYDVADELLQKSLALYRKIGLTTGISLVLSALGRNAIYNGQQTAVAKEYYKESMALAKQDHNEISVIVTLSGFALCEVMEKNADAKNYLREAILLSQSLHFYEALAWSLEIWSLVSLNEHRPVHAVTLMGAVEHLRSTTQLPVWEDLKAIIVEARNSIAGIMDPVAFASAWELGAGMSIDRMASFAMEE